MDPNMAPIGCGNVIFDPAQWTMLIGQILKRCVSVG